MIYACARRITDGLLTWADGSPTEPHQTAVRQNAVNALGGVLSDWEYVELTETQYTALMSAMPGRSFLSGGTLSSKPAPSISTDKVQIANDGSDAATISFDVENASYTGEVKWRVTAPDGTLTTLTDNAVAGVVTLELTTTHEGTHSIEAEAVTQGVGLITVEGI